MNELEKLNKNSPEYVDLDLGNDEDLYLMIRHHWAGFLGYILISLGMLLVPVMIIASMLMLEVNFADYYRLIIVASASFVLFIITFMFGAWINFYYDIIFITSEKLINVNQKGLLSRSTSKLNLRQVQNVSAKKDGILQSFFDYGTVVIETAGGGTSDNVNMPGLQGYFTINDVPDPESIAKVIIELNRRRARKARPQDNEGIS